MKPSVMNQTLIKLCLLILAAALSCSAQVRTVCVMPVQDDAALQRAVEKWVESMGLHTVDCITGKEKGDVVLGFFFNSSNVVNPSFYLYRQGRYITVIPDRFPPMGVTIWLQSHNEGFTVGGLFIGRMYFYGQAANLNDGLKKIRRTLHRMKVV